MYERMFVQRVEMPRDRRADAPTAETAVPTRLRNAEWAAKKRDERRAHQLEGRRRARQSDPLHQAGCMLYWAEGTKDRNVLKLSNSDANLVRFFHRFLVTCFDLHPIDFAVSLHVYSGNGLSIEDIESHWLTALRLPRSCLRKHTIDVRPSSSAGSKGNKLPFGVCTLRVLRSTPILQHIYGAIQEYGEFEEPAWLG
jgi:hypothetical protein